MSWTVLGTALVVVVLAGLEAALDPGRHAVPGATALFALAASAALVGAAKVLRAAGLERPEGGDD